MDLWEKYPVASAFANLARLQRKWKRTKTEIKIPIQEKETTILRSRFGRTRHQPSRRKALAETNEKGKANEDADEKVSAKDTHRIRWEKTVSS